EPRERKGQVAVLDRRAHPLSRLPHRGGGETDQMKFWLAVSGVGLDLDESSFQSGEEARVDGGEHGRDAKECTPKTQPSPLRRRFRTSSKPAAAGNRVFGGAEFRAFAGTRGFQEFIRDTNSPRQIRPEYTALHPRRMGLEGNA